MTAVDITYFEKPSQDENLDNCQQIAVKLKRTFLEFVTVDSISGRLFTWDKRYVGSFHFQEDTEASLYGDYICKICSLFHALCSSMRMKRFP